MFLLKVKSVKTTHPSEGGVARQQAALKVTLVVKKVAEASYYLI